MRLVLEEHGEEEADGPLAHDDGEIAGAGVGHPDGLDAGIDGLDEAGGVEGNAIGNQLDAAFDDPVHDADVLGEAAAGGFKAGGNAHLFVDGALGVELAFAVEAFAAGDVVEGDDAIAPP
jgi:hypothetical protein